MGDVVEETEKGGLEAVFGPGRERVADVPQRPDRKYASEVSVRQLIVLGLLAVVCVAFAESHMKYITHAEATLLLVAFYVALTFFMVVLTVAMCAYKNALIRCDGLRGQLDEARRAAETGPASVHSITPRAE